MNLKDMLVFLDTGNASDGRLRLAANIARKHRACLKAAFPQTSRAPGFPFGLDVPRLEPGRGPANPCRVGEIPPCALEEMAEQRFRQNLQSLGVQGDWHPLVNADTSFELIFLARAADLVILGQVNPTSRPAPTWKPGEEIGRGLWPPGAYGPLYRQLFRHRSSRPGCLGRFAGGGAGDQ